MKTTLSIEESKVRELYNKGCEGVKEILEESFGKEFFSQDRVKTYEDACNELGALPLDESKLMELGLTKHDIAYQKLATIIKALNKGWIAGVCNDDVCRWYPYFRLNKSPSSFVFCDSTYDNSSVLTCGGSRLCLKSHELSDYCGKQFVELWKQFML